MSPKDAPIGDVSAALAVVDSHLKRFGTDQATAGRDELLTQYMGSLGRGGASDVLDGACTLLYVFMQWLRSAHESQDKDVLEYVLPYVVGTLKHMRTVSDEGIPTMAAMMTASVVDVSPSLWRHELGSWRREEMTAFEVTLFILARRINELCGDENAATQMVIEALDAAEDGEPE
ncbi:hypothetical protein ACFPCY_00825 [Actinomadura gamaensis]|uniref:Uncharacterized protein n=2 Tax=Actinomadura gamaensis TaxID=1763541 RepID=A0ABV9TRH5_9ACTN